MKFDPYQLKVIKFPLVADLALRVVANAGAGKSTTMLYKVKNLLEQGHHASSIVLVSFSRKSRADLQAKWKKIQSQEKTTSTPFISTIHSLGLVILRSYFSLDFKLLRPNDQLKILNTLLEELNLQAHVSDKKRELFCLQDYLSFLKANDLPYEQSERPYPGDLEESQVTDLLIRYEQYKTKENYLDYDDLVLHTYRLLKKNPKVLKKVRQKFQVFIVDESQDLNLANWKLIMILAEGQNLISVGDPCQNIYRFRYAKPELFSKEYFEQYFSQVVELSLPYNYRSTKEIVDLGNLIRGLHGEPLAIPVKESQSHSLKIYKESTANQEGRLVVRIIKALLNYGYRPEDITVICRSTNFLNTVVERFFIENNLAYKILAGNNVSFLESHATNIFINLLAVVADSKNFVAFAALIPYLNGMGEFKRGKRGFETLGKTAELYTKLILKHRRADVTTGKKLDTTVKNFYQELTHISLKDYDSLVDVLETLLKIHYKYVKERYHVKPSQFQRLKNTIMNFINDYKQEKRADFKEALWDLLLNLEQYDPDESGKITLSTVHAQKGLESKVSIVCGFRSLGQVEDLGDEINVLYVQLSRAIEKLIIIRSECVRRANGKVLAGKENPHLQKVLELWEEKDSDFLS